MEGEGGGGVHLSQKGFFFHTASMKKGTINVFLYFKELLESF